jgi:hypothetical protein
MSYDPDYHIPRIREKRRADGYLRMKEALNRKLRHLYHGSTSATAIELVGCDSKALRKHLRSLFKNGMTHKNYGQWHIDHIKPCASFDLKDVRERAKCYHYTNLAPRWAFDNISKKDKVR